MAAMLTEVQSHLPVSCLAVHCHDTYGQALANILVALQVSTESVEKYRIQIVVSNFFSYK